MVWKRFALRWRSEAAWGVEVVFGKGETTNRHECWAWGDEELADGDVFCALEMR